MFSFLTIRNIRVIFPFLIFIFSLSVFHFAFSEERTEGPADGKQTSDFFETLMEQARKYRTHRAETIKQTEYTPCADRYLTLNELMEIFNRAIDLQEENDLCKFSGFRYFDSITEATKFSAYDGYSGPLFVTSILKQDEDDLVWDSMITTFRDNAVCLRPNLGNDPDRDVDGFIIDYSLRSASAPKEEMHTKHNVHKRSTTMEFDGNGRLIRVLTTSTELYGFVFDFDVDAVPTPIDRTEGSRFSCEN